MKRAKFPKKLLPDDTNRGEASWPLFFKSPVPISIERHAQAGVVPSGDYRFAAATNSIPLNVPEFVEAAKHYPIVFTMDEMPSPAIVVGLEQANYYVDDKGHWLADHYVPSYVRKYPFVFMEDVSNAKFLLCVDEESPHFRAQKTDDFLAFYEHGQPTEVTQNALEFCMAFQNHHQGSRQLGQALKEAGLLIPQESEVKLFNGRVIQLAGFQLIDEEAFNKLSDATILEFKKKGFLPYIYFAFMSSSNWRRLVELAASLEPKTTTH